MTTVAVQPMRQEGMASNKYKESRICSLAGSTQLISDKFVEPRTDHRTNLVLGRKFRNMSASSLFYHGFNIEYLKELIDKESVCCEDMTNKIFNSLIDNYILPSVGRFKSHRKLEVLHLLNEDFINTYAKHSLRILQNGKRYKFGIDRDPDAYGITAESFKGGYYTPEDYFLNNPYNEGPAWKPIVFNIRTARNFEYKKSTFGRPDGSFGFPNAYRRFNEPTEDSLGHQILSQSGSFVHPSRKNYNRRGQYNMGSGVNYFDDTGLVKGTQLPSAEHYSTRYGPHANGTEDFQASRSRGYPGITNDDELVLRFEDPGGVPFWRRSVFRRNYDQRAANEGLVNQGQGDWAVNHSRQRYHNRAIFDRPLGRPNVPLDQIQPDGSF